MCRTQCVLALVVLSVGLAHSWDIAVITGDQLEFYSNNNKTHSEGVQFGDLTALAYDAVHNMLLFVDKQSDNGSIFSFNITSKKYQSLVRRRSYENIHYENIQGLAFDPVKNMLFWTDTNERSIFWISMKPNNNIYNNIYGNLLIKMDDEIPTAIAIDSCRGYIYWTNTNITKPTIERARFDGSEREVIISTNIYMPVSLAIDQQTNQIYWVDDRKGIHYSIESADLNGKNRTTLLLGTHHQPKALTISKDSIYWVDWGYRSVWQFPMNPSKDAEPTPITSFQNEMPIGITANYKIEEQTRGNPECEALTSLPQNKSSINDSFNIPTDVGLFCVHGIKLNGKSLCNCTLGYTGERCDISVCQNYCFRGDCSLNDEGEPKCSCYSGYSGERCEVNSCTGYCLNNGGCFLDEKSEPVCLCIGGHEGSRCEATPPRSGSELISDSDCSQGASGSILNKDDEKLATLHYANTRKIKECPEEGEYNQTLLSFQAEMMKFMEDFGNKQNNNLQYIREEISEIKNEIKTIKLNSEYFTQHIEKINKEIENIKSDNNITKKKIIIIN